VAETLAEILTRDGHIVDAAPDGAAGLARLTDAAYDVIFSDLRMPKLDGPAFYARLARDLPEAQRRVAFITGDTLTPQAATFLEAARRPALQKPFSPEDVRRVVRRILAERPADA
jgi:CheY-like chemotaxis protein